jgi:anti-sigma regulatory factor (Ser/Thr protein kinase)
MYDGSITIVCRNDIAEVERLQHKISQFSELHGVGKRSQHAFNLALDELVTNIVRHGYSDQEPHEIKVEISLAGTALSATITDDGKAFNPADHPAVDCTKPIQERQLGGLGIHLVRSLITRIDYKREDGKNVLTILKRLQ